MRITAIVLTAILLAAPLESRGVQTGGAKPSASSKASPSPKPRTVKPQPVVELPSDYAAVLKRASKGRATLQVLPIQRKGDGAERSFLFAQEAQSSGLFAKVSVGTVPGRADYAVYGHWQGGHKVALGNVGFAEWMDVSAGIDLVFIQGKNATKVEVRETTGTFHSPPPYTEKSLLDAADEGLRQCFQLALYRIAKDIIKQGGL